ncbi:MAG TPA: response regulator [Pseudomonadales bacterium]|nr:response regulator [Pseudomonadales bacterium]
MNMRVMVVDDDVNILKAIRRLVSTRENYTVELFESPEDAIERMGKEKFDVIFSDYKMPGMNGLELLESSLTVSPESIRILLSGLADMDVLAESINRCKIHHFIQKPWQADNILEVIDTAYGAKVKSSDDSKILDMFSNKKQALSLAFFADDMFSGTDKKTGICNDNENCISRLKISIEKSLAMLGIEKFDYYSAIKDGIGSRRRVEKAQFIFNKYPQENSGYFDTPRKISTKVLEEKSIRGSCMIYGSWKTLRNMIREETSEIEYKLHKSSNDKITESEYKNGYFSSHMDNKRHTILYFSKDKNDICNITRSDFSTINKIINLCNHAIENASKCNFCRIKTGKNPIEIERLTEKQKNILRYFLHDSSAPIKSAANVHNVSVDAVNFHLRNVRIAMKMPRASPHTLAALANSMGLM